MRRGHFETLRPICPVCRTENREEFPLQLAHVEREADGHLLEGSLHCSNPRCQREYPIIDGVPILVANIRQCISNQILALYGRRDLSDFAESIISDCCGPGSQFDQNRQHLSSYAWDHYGEFDPLEEHAGAPPGSLNRVMRVGFELAGVLAGHEEKVAPVLDLGCSVGGATFRLAEWTGGLALGVDLNFVKLRLAGEILRSGKVRYPRRRVGLVYESREFPVTLPAAERVDFWACDIAALPFREEEFGLITALNLLDCVGSPRDLLTAIERILKNEGWAILCSPYDWAPSAAPVEAWLGGHSQRSPIKGSSETVLRLLLTPDAHPGSLKRLRLIAEREGLPWHVRLHDRATMTYRSHLVVIQKA